MTHREVIVSGVGLISPLGRDVAENWARLKARKTGIRHFSGDALPPVLQHRGEVAEIQFPEDISPKLMGQMKFLNRGALLGFCAANEAMSKSRLDLTTIEPQRRALFVAAGDFTKVGYDFMYPAIRDSADEHWQRIDHAKLNRSALNKVNPFFLLESLNNNLFSFLSAYLGFMGPNSSLATLSPCGGNALELAYRSISQNAADIAMAVGYGNWITEIPLFELEGLGILSRCRRGIGSFKPFDKSRDGFIPGEGGAAILLEASETAQQRGDQGLAAIKGFGNCIEPSSNFRMSLPERVSQRSMQLALQQAGCSVDELGFIIPHGSGTQKGDRSELRSMQAVLGDHATRIPICGLKPYSGHLGAASDIGEVIFGILGAKEGLVPATLNFGAVEKDFSDLKISGSHQRCARESFLSVSYGLVGQSTSVVVKVR